MTDILGSHIYCLEERNDKIYIRTVSFTEIQTEILLLYEYGEIKVLEREERKIGYAFVERKLGLVNRIKGQFKEHNINIKINDV